MTSHNGVTGHNRESGGPGINESGEMDEGGRKPIQLASEAKTGHGNSLPFFLTNL